MTTGPSHIALYGTGLALEYALASLRRAMPADVIFTVIEDGIVQGETVQDGGVQDGAVQDGSIEHGASADYDVLYGSVMPPQAYSFHLQVGLQEPDVILQTGTSLSYGSGYSNWGGVNWVQAYNLPFPIWSGVRFHHYLTRAGAPLEPFLSGAMAGRAGRFAHPPEDKQVPLSRAEYGYQVDVAEMTALLKASNSAPNIKRLHGPLRKVITDNRHITALEISDGQRISADFYIDVSGPDTVLLESMGGDFQDLYAVDFIHSQQQAQTGGSPLRLVEGRDHGWDSVTPLQDKVIKQTVCLAGTSAGRTDFHDPKSLRSIKCRAGRQHQTWMGNCVAIGTAAAVIEPLTIAPFLLLMKDIERLVSLIPVTQDMAVESKEYNRRFINDYDHAMLFHLAFFQLETHPETDYWQAMKALDVPEKLQRKIDQFISRGDLVNYDLEPFNEQDWTILHFGMGRRASRYDIYMDHIDDAVVQKNLMAVGQSIEQMVQKMPPHATYIAKMKNYLERRHG